MGEIDDAYLKAESKVLRDARQGIDERLTQIPGPITQPSAAQLRGATEQVAASVRDAEGDEFELLLQALQIEVRAEKGRGELVGVIPDYASPSGHADVRSMVINSECLKEFRSE